MRQRLRHFIKLLAGSRLGRLALGAWGWMPLTWRSVIALALLAWVRQVYGIERYDLILLVVGTGGLLLVAVAVIAVLVAAVSLRLQRPPRPGERWVLQTGAPWRTGYGVGVLSWLPLVRISLSWREPRDVSVRLVPSRARLVEEIVAGRRGEAESLVRRWTVSDTFGLAQVSFDVPSAQSLKVLPDPGRLHPQELFQQMASGDVVSHPNGEPEGDYIEMRRYAPGDPLKRVLWKVFARTRKLLVRVPERAIAPRQKTLAYLVTDRRDEPAAGTARAALEQGVFGPDFLFSADGEAHGTREIGEAVEQVVRSASVGSRGGGEGLSEFMARGHAEGARACVVFAPARLGPWVERVAEQARAHPRQVHVVLAAERIYDDAPVPLWRRLLFADSAPAERHGARELHKVWERLNHAGASITVLDRRTGLRVPMVGGGARQGRA